MPQEIARVIRNYSASSLFWRFTSALDLAALLRAIPPNDFISVPLCEVTEWEPDSGAPTISTDSDRLNSIRLTIDSRGISRVERLPTHYPQHTSRRFDNMVFVILDKSCLDGVVALFKVRLCLILSVYS